ALLRRGSLVRIQPRSPNPFQILPVEIPRKERSGFRRRLPLSRFGLSLTPSRGSSSNPAALTKLPKKSPKRDPSTLPRRGIAQDFACGLRRPQSGSSSNPAALTNDAEAVPKGIRLFLTVEGQGNLGAVESDDDGTTNNNDWSSHVPELGKLGYDPGVRRYISFVKLYSLL